MTTKDEFSGRLTTPGVYTHTRARDGGGRVNMPPQRYLVTKETLTLH